MKSIRLSEKDVNDSGARDPLTSRAYFETGTETGDYLLSVHADLLKVKRPTPRDILMNQKPIGGCRGKVRGFSRASRKRMIEFMSSLRSAGSMLFVTLTYPDIYPPGSWNWKRHFEAFRDRFEAHYANYRGLWRIELVTRKSGMMKGSMAPHWHILLFLPALDAVSLEAEAAFLTGELRQHWYEIVGSGDEKHLEHGVDVAPVRSRKQAYAYVSKYIAKGADDKLEIGRRWGRIGKFDTSAGETVRLTFDEYVAFKRIVKRWMKGRGGKFYKRFARMSPVRGCAVLGMGDEAQAGWWIFIYEAMRQVAEMRELERGYGT